MQVHDNLNGPMDAREYRKEMPSKEAIRIARVMCQGNKIYVYGGLPDFCGHNYGWADEMEIARLIDRVLNKCTETGR